jgi:flagellar M-ring protein FliF
VSNLTNMLEPLRAWWESATMQTRAAAAGLGALVIIGLVFAAVLASSPDYTPIFRAVSGKDASKIEAALHDHNIPMQFDDKDGTVSVPSKNESEATMAVAAADILDKDKDAATVSGISNAPFGMTDPTTQQENIRAANQARIAQLLQGLEPVSKAEVIIAPGNSTSLFGDNVPPTASVTLGLKQGETLSDDQVKGIVNLIVSACTGMTSKNVSITDESGSAIWDPDSGETGLSADKGAKADREYAQSLKTQLQDELSVFGLQNMRVAVTAHLDHDATTIDSTQSTAGPVISTHEKTETLSGSGAGAAVGGAPGATSNTGLPTYGGGGNGSGGDYKSDDATQNHDNNKTHTVVTKGPGDVKFVSAAVLVNTTVPAANLDAIKETVSKLIDALPGDTTHLYTVQQVAFDNSAQKAAATAMKSLASQELITNIVKFVAVSIAGCVLLYLLTRTGTRRMASVPQMALAGEGANIGLLEGASDMELENILEERPLRIEDVLAEMPDVGDAPRSRRRRMHAPSIEEQQDLKLESIQDMIGSHPESVALLMKGWMVE